MRRMAAKIRQYVSIQKELDNDDLDCYLLQNDWGLAGSDNAGNGFLTSLFSDRILVNL